MPYTEILACARMTRHLCRLPPKGEGANTPNPHPTLTLTLTLTLSLREREYKADFSPLPEGEG